MFSSGIAFYLNKSIMRYYMEYARNCCLNQLDKLLERVYTVYRALGPKLFNLVWATHESGFF